MTAAIVNLRQRRKQRARAEGEAAAAANRARFGEAKPAKTARRGEDARAAAELDGKRRGPGHGPE